MLSNHLILCGPLLLVLNLSQRQGFFQWNALFLRWPNLGASASAEGKVDFLYNWLVWYTCSLRDSQESSPIPQFESINSWALSLLYGPTLTSVCDYWKNHSFDCMDLCQQSDVSAFKHTVFVSFPSEEQASFNFMAAVTICSNFDLWCLLNLKIFRTLLSNILK